MSNEDDAYDWVRPAGVPSLHVPGGVMDNQRSQLMSYGLAIDEAMGAMANAMASLGYPTKFASRTSAAPDGWESELRGALAQLGQVCLRMEVLCKRDGDADSSTAVPSDEAVSFLAVHAAARRVHFLIRAAQQSRLLRGGVEAEIDGDVDELDEALFRLESTAHVISAARGLVESAAPFCHLLPTSVRDEIEELSSILEAGQSGTK